MVVAGCGVVWCGGVWWGLVGCGRVWGRVGRVGDGGGRCKQARVQGDSKRP